LFRRCPFVEIQFRAAVFDGDVAVPATKSICPPNREFRP
jgi:hypothetical protein